MILDGTIDELQQFTYEAVADLQEELQNKIVEIPNDAARLALTTPEETFYYVIETKKLWRYQSGEWTQVGGENTVMSETAPVDQLKDDTWLEVLA